MQGTALSHLVHLVESYSLLERKKSEIITEAGFVGVLSAAKNGKSDH